jgi:hypothetical protein
MNESNDSQNAQILLYLRQGKTITSLEALRLFGCLRLSGRIFDLRQRQIPIKARTLKTLSGKRVAEYYLEPVKP